MSAPRLVPSTDDDHVSGAVPLACSCRTTSLPTPAGEVIVLRIAGELDIASGQLVQTALRAVFAHPPSHLLIDMSGLTFCDVGGLALLVQAGSTAAAAGIGYAVSGPSYQADRAMVLLWPEDELPTRHPTVRSGVLAAVAGQHERGNQNRSRPALQVVPDPNRFATATEQQLIIWSRGGDIEAYRTLARPRRSPVSRWSACPCSSS